MIAYEDSIGGLFYLFDGRSISKNDFVHLAEKFNTTVIVVQNLAVFALAPVYLATAITEGAKGNVDLLHTTQLHDREIILSKLVGRMGHLAGVLLAGLPVLSLAQFMGGVDMGLLLANFALTAINLWTAASVCIFVWVIANESGGDTTSARRRQHHFSGDGHGRFAATDSSGAAQPWTTVSINPEGIVKPRETAKIAPMMMFCRRWKRMCFFRKTKKTSRGYWVYAGIVTLFGTFLVLFALGMIFFQHDDKSYAHILLAWIFWLGLAYQMCAAWRGNVSVAPWKPYSFCPLTGATF